MHFYTLLFIYDYILLLRCDTMSQSIDLSGQPDRERNNGGFRLL